MFWIFLWIVLIIGAVVALAIAAVSTFRKALAALNGAGEAMSVLEQLGAKLDAQPVRGTQSPGPSVATDRNILVTRVSAVRVRRDEKRKVARGRHKLSYQRWMSISGWSSGPISRGNSRRSS